MNLFVSIRHEHRDHGLQNGKHINLRKDHNYSKYEKHEKDLKIKHEPMNGLQNGKYIS